MKLVNGFKLMYEKGIGDERHIYASKEAIPTSEDEVTVPNIGSYPNAKLFYQKDNELYVSESNIPTADDESFTVTSDGTVVIGVADDPVAPPAVAAQADESVTPKRTRSKKVVVEETVEDSVE